MNEETLSNSNLDSDEIEEIEKLTLRWVFKQFLILEWKRMKFS